MLKTKPPRTEKKGLIKQKHQILCDIPLPKRHVFAEVFDENGDGAEHCARLIENGPCSGKEAADIADICPISVCRLGSTPPPRIAGHYMFRIGNPKPLAVLGGGVDPKYPRTLIYLGIPINGNHAPCH